ncbi:unnamed protein product [marine sediment metagenome]|uniref:Uncharacterized protein n=1 Tax=marine sediment metagenome TaxID=412755 RepID=X0ZLV3_9ZZZZ
MEGTKTRKHINLSDERMIVVSKMAKARHARTAIVILSICLVGYLFTGVPLVNAQTEESPSPDERLAYIEGTLEQMNERLLGLNHLSDRIDGLGDSLSVRIDNLYITIIGSTIVLVCAILAQPFLIEKKISNK